MPLRKGYEVHSRRGETEESGARRPFTILTTGAPHFGKRNSLRESPIIFAGLRAAFHNLPKDSLDIDWE